MKKVDKYREVTDERRRHERLNRPLDAEWQGASGSGRCRIGDISLGGCFVQTLVSPALEEKTAVTLIGPAGQPILLEGSVVTTYPGIGFALRFEPMPPETEDLLRQVIDGTAPSAG